MSHIQYTICRSGTYYYNRRVPSHAVKAYGSFIRQAQPTGSVEKTLGNDELGLLLDTFLQQHPCLTDGICSDQGIRLMNVDSHITNQHQRVCKATETNPIRT